MLGGRKGSISYENTQHSQLIHDGFHSQTMVRRPLRLLCSIASSAAVNSFQLPATTPLNAALQLATEAFVAAAVPEPALSAEHLLTRCAGFGNDRKQLTLHASEPLDEAAARAFECMCKRRFERVPVQYILGDWDFHDLTLEMRPPVLIPRPETEELVEHVLEALGDDHRTGGRGARRSSEIDILDVGCGTGAIGLALLNRLPNARCVGIDICPTAHALSKANAERCGLSARYESLLVDGGIAACDLAPRRFDVIVSNPPYIPRADMATLEPEVAWHEDAGALCGGSDGLDVVRELLLATPRLLRADGPRSIWLEVDTSHPPVIERWLGEQAALGLQMVRWMRDAYGRPRFCEIRHTASHIART